MCATHVTINYQLLGSWHSQYHISVAYLWWVLRQWIKTIYDQLFRLGGLPRISATLPRHCILLYIHYARSQTQIAIHV